MSRSLRQARGLGGRVRAGFTLIELLVVIAIIGLLVSILLPSLKQAMVLARTMKCQAHLRELGMAAHLYAQDNNDVIPRNDFNGAKNRTFWATGLALYIGDKGLEEEDLRDNDAVEEWVYAQEFYTCPALENDKPGIDYSVNHFDWDAYRLNIEQGRGLEYKDLYKHSDTDRDAPDAVDLSFIDAPPADLIYLGECSRRFSLKYHDMHSDSHTPYNRWGDPKGGRMIKPSDKRHDGRTTFVAFDGHAEQQELTWENFPMRKFVPNHIAP